MSNPTNFYDIIVIGSGAAGLSCALTAGGVGANVVVLEKMHFPGGTSLFAEGMFAVQSPLQERESVTLTKDQAFKNHMMGTHWRANALLVRQFIEMSANNIAWLQEMRLQFADVVPLWPGGPRTWHIIQGGGKALIQVLAENTQKNSVQVHLNTGVTKITVDREKQVYCVFAKDKEGHEIPFEAKTIVLACGGFTSNKEMIAKYTSAPKNAEPVIDLHQTGEVIEMGWELGGMVEGAGVLLSVPAVLGETPHSHLWAAGIQPHLWVNLSGERFCDETIFFQFPYAANALANQERSIIYCIFDERAKQDMIEKGVPIGLGVFVPPGSKLEKLDQEMERGIQEGKAYKADSIVELAKKAGIDSSALKYTVDSYNRACVNQRDNLCAKDSAYLQPIHIPRYYAIQVSYHMFTTLGGLKINHRTELIDKKQTVIPGLYAAGNCAAGMYGEDYEVFSSGGALSFAISSGRIAAMSALKYLEEH